MAQFSQHWLRQVRAVWSQRRPQAKLCLVSPTPQRGESTLVSTVTPHCPSGVAHPFSCCSQGLWRALNGQHGLCVANPPERHSREVRWGSPSISGGRGVGARSSEVGFARDVDPLCLGESSPGAVARRWRRLREEGCGQGVASGAKRTSGFESVDEL